MRRQDQWVFLDNYRRKLALKYELKRKLLKSFQKNQQLTLTQKLFISLHNSLLPNSSAVNKQNNRCLISGRNRSVFKKTRSSRFIFRSLANNANLPGVHRYSR